MELLVDCFVWHNSLKYLSSHARCWFPLWPSPLTPDRLHSRALFAQGFHSIHQWETAGRGQWLEEGWDEPSFPHRYLLQMCPRAGCSFQKKVMWCPYNQVWKFCNCTLPGPFWCSMNAILPLVLGTRLSLAVLVKPVSTFGFVNSSFVGGSSPCSVAALSVLC